jgi:PAS domain S-box-containing protein
MYIELILNLTMLVALSLVSSFIIEKWPEHTLVGKFLVGIFYGTVSALGMMRPFIYDSGIILDGRSIMISLCALFFGPLSVSVASALAIVCRIWIGGAGMVTGILAVLSSATVGLLFRINRQYPVGVYSVRRLFFFGIMVHLLMLLVFFTLPELTPAEVIKKFSIPVLIFYPLATILAGKILSDQWATRHLFDSLQKSNENLNVTLESIGDAVVSTDLTGKITRMNHTAQYLTGWTFDEAKDKHLSEVFKIFNATTGKTVSNPVELVLQKGEIVGLANHTMLVSKNGERFQISDSAAPIKNKESEIIGVVLVFSDITEKYSIQQKLKESETLYKDLFQANPHPMWIYNIQTHRFLHVNQTAIAHYGYTKEEFRSMSIEDINDQEKITEQTVPHLVDQLIEPVQTTFHKKRDNTTIEVELSSHPLLYEGIESMLVLAYDVTERKATKNAILAAQEQINQYIIKIENAFMRTVEVAMTLSEMRDPYTAGHERRVGDLAIAIGKEMRLDSHRLDGLRIAGYLHDIGKITIPSELLSKPRKLTDIEYALVKEHARASYDVLKDIDFPWEIARMTLEHHERVDGSGYPQGLKGDETLLESRIIAVADVIESMSSHRPYRPGLGIKAALFEIRTGSGKIYDPDVVNACIALFQEKKYVL